jgi:putative acyl-CoA dehydrogenase
MRLKRKLGNQSNASAEIEYHDTWAERIGEEGDGVRQIIRMVHHTRLDTAMAPAGLMRAALSEAKWWCEGRNVFQRRLIDQPLMRSVLADLVLDWEGATALGLRVAAAFDDPDQTPFARVAVAVAKYLNNKICPRLIYEAMECLGGMGYTDDTPMPMLYREAPLNSIWEGSGNVICLDVLRTLDKDRLARDMLDAELQKACGSDQEYDQALNAYQNRWRGRPDESEARRFTEQTALLLTESVLLQHAPSAVSDAYLRTRLTNDRGHTAGTVSGLDTHSLIERI